MTLKYEITKKLHRNGIIYRCVKCGEYGLNDLKETTEYNLPPYYSNKVSHGLCSYCFEKEMEKLRKMRRSLE